MDYLLSCIDPDDKCRKDEHYNHTATDYNVKKSFQISQNFFAVHDWASRLAVLSQERISFPICNNP